MAPHKWVIPIHRKNKQFPQPIDTSELLYLDCIKQVQRTAGSFLYYARAIDNIIVPALNEIALSQAKPTKNTDYKIQMLLDYLFT